MYIVSYCSPDSDIIRAVEIAANSKLDAFNKAESSGIKSADIIDVYLWRVIK